MYSKENSGEGMMDVCTLIVDCGQLNKAPYGVFNGGVWGLAVFPSGGARGHYGIVLGHILSGMYLPGGNWHTMPMGTKQVAWGYLLYSLGEIPIHVVG